MFSQWRYDIRSAGFRFIDWRNPENRRWQDGALPYAMRLGENRG